MVQDNFSLISSLYSTDIKAVNKHFISSHISERKFRQIVRFYCLDIEATKTAELTGISRQSINKIYTAIRQRIVDICSVPIQPTIGEFELDESYFGAHRVRSIRGRGTHGKIIIFGIFKRPNTIYIVNNGIENFWERGGM